MTTPTANAGLIWAIAELLRGDYKQSDYGKIILPFTLLRRLDGCVRSQCLDFSASMLALPLPSVAGH